MIKEKIEDVKEIISNVFINVVDDKDNEKVFFVIRIGKGLKSEAPILYGYFLDEIMKNPEVLIADSSLQKALYFKNIRIKEFRFTTKEQKSELLCFLQKSFNDFQKKTLQAVLDKLAVIQNFILSIDDKTKKEEIAFKNTS